MKSREIPVLRLGVDGVGIGNRHDVVGDDVGGALEPPRRQLVQHLTFVRHAGEHTVEAVIANADRLSIVQLSDAVAQLAAACRSRTIAREQLTGGTFTISNVGSYGGMFATPIINYPEVAIIAAGRAKEKVLVRHGSFFAGKVLPLSVSCDHRVVDGAEGARFLNTVVKLLENPEGLVA